MADSRIEFQIMKVETYAALSAEEKEEVKALYRQFIEAVKNTKLGDGGKFASRYKVLKVAGFFVCSDGISVLPGIRTLSRKSLEALVEDASMNYGRF